MIYDATACPQDIAYPTDVALLNKSREVTEAIIDQLHAINPQGKKPRSYRKVARKRFLKVAQNKRPSREVIRKGSGKPCKTQREEPGWGKVWAGQKCIRDEPGQGKAIMKTTLLIYENHHVIQAI